jgi:hypothetical protein
MSKEQIQEELQRARIAEKAITEFLELPSLPAITNRCAQKSYVTYHHSEVTQDALRSYISTLEEMMKDFNVHLEQISTESLEQELEKRKSKDVTAKRPRTNDPSEKRQLLEFDFNPKYTNTFDTI